MRAANRNSLGIWIAALAIVAVIAAWQRAARLSFVDPAFGSGWLLFALILFLGLYNGRKRLAMVPVGRASTWLTLHVVGGVAALALFWLHTGVLWPSGAAKQLLAALFYLVYLSGIVGYLLQLWVPGRLARAGREIIYERVPAEVAEIREAVEKAVLAAAEESGYDTLGRYYLETLAWYFARPRFVWSHAFGGRRGQFWLRSRLGTIGHYLSEPEQRRLAEIAELGAAKTAVDIQYALQSLLKRWPLFHVPLAAAMVMLALWHLVLVHVFAR